MTSTFTPTPVSLRGSSGMQTADRPHRLFHPVELAVAVRSSHHSTGKICYVRLFLQRALQAVPEYAGLAMGQLGSPVVVKMRFPVYMFADTQLFAWAYTMRPMRANTQTDGEAGAEKMQRRWARHLISSQHTRIGAAAAADELGQKFEIEGDPHTEIKGQEAVQLYTQRIGTGGVSVWELDGKASSIPLYDCLQVQVGEMNIQLTATGRNAIYLEDVIPASITTPEAARLRALQTVQQHCRWLSTKAALPDQSLVVGLHPRQFIDIQLPCGRVPMWSFAWMTTRKEVHHPETEKLFKHLLSVGRYCMGINSSVEPDTPELAELLCEMQLLPVRHHLYIVDSTIHHGHDQVTHCDEWTYIGDQPDSRMRAYDCEDGTAAVCEMAHLLSVVETKDPALLQMQALERQYVTFFALGSLRLANSDKRTYHAFGLKLDRRFVLSMIGRSSNKTDKEHKQSKGWLPACLLETTNYAAACWDYTPDKRVQVFSDDVHPTTPVEPLRKIPATIVQEQGMHEVAFTLFAPALLDEYGIAQIELRQHGKSGVPVKDMMHYSSNQSWLAVQIADKEAIPAVERVWSAMPITPAPAAPRKGHAITARVVPRGLRVLGELWYRESDYVNHSVHQALLDMFPDDKGYSLTEQRISVVDELAAVHVRVCRKS